MQFLHHSCMHAQRLASCAHVQLSTETSEPAVLSLTRGMWAATCYSSPLVCLSVGDFRVRSGCHSATFTAWIASTRQVIVIVADFDVKATLHVGYIELARYIAALIQGTIIITHVHYYSSPICFHGVVQSRIFAPRKFCPPPSSC